MEITAFHDRLSWARRHHARITQRKLAERMKRDYNVSVGANYISEIELDKGKRPTFEVVRAMAGALGISLDWLADFSEEMLLAREKSGDAEYFSPEADEVARLVDAMIPAQRTAILSIAQTMIAPTQQQLDRAEASDIMQSIEEQLGGDVRREVERMIRGKRTPLDSAA